jgi:hypothetical protein
VAITVLDASVVIAFLDADDAHDAAAVDRSGRQTMLSRRARIV